MIKLMVASLVFLFSLTSVASTTACLPAQPTNSTGFCSSFKVSAECYCAASGLPKGMCGNMNKLYDRMVSMFGSLQKACEFQKNTTPQACVEDWVCYRFGGSNSQNQLCSTTGKPCE